MGKVTGKKLLVGIILSCAIILGVAVQAQAAWSHINKAYGLYESVAINPVNTQELYLGSRDGNAESITGNNGFFKSTNGGSSWTRLTGVPQSGCQSILVDPLNPKVVYAAFWGISSRSGLYKSTNSGVSWVKLGASTGLPEDSYGCYHITALKTSPLTLIVGHNKGVYRSTNGGATWVKTNLPRPYTISHEPIAGAASNPNIVYALATYVYKSTDAGKTWFQLTSLTASSYYTEVVVDPKNANRVYVVGGLGINQGVYKTDNGGTSWTKLPTLTASTAARSLVIDSLNPQILYMGGSGGIYKSTNGGGNWVKLPDHAQYSSNTWSLAIDPKNPKIIYQIGSRFGTQSYLYGLFKNTNGGY